MSNDTAECGCEGHVENFSECKYPALEADNAALLYRLTALARRTLSAVDGMRDPDLEAARETALRAEADLKAGHMGAALLERVRAMECVLTDIHNTPWQCMSMDQQADISRKVQRLVGLGGA